MGEWANQVISFTQLKIEVVEKVREYIKYIVANNTESIVIAQLKDEFEEICSYASKEKSIAYKTG